MPTVGIDLPDVSVWLALTDPDHAHHARAEHYWTKEKAPRVALFRVTLLGMLRLLSNPKSMNGNPFTAERAWEIGQTYLSLPEVALYPDSPVADKHLAQWSKAKFFSPGLWTDAWIAALALEHSCRVVSFDADFAKFPGLDFLHLEP
jgi:toxin-antitoxin system PIN domain toxin